MRRLTLSIVLACALTSASYASGPQDENETGPVRFGITIQEMTALKPLVLYEMRNDLIGNGERLSQASIREQFRRSKFSTLSLGKLGKTVLVEFHDPEGGPNSGWYIIYLRRSRKFARIAVGSGFGPYVLTGINGIPDLAFGSTSGACTEYFERLRYSGTHYNLDACVHWVSDSNSDDCHPEACNDSRKLPMFPPPDPSTMQ